MRKNKKLFLCFSFLFYSSLLGFTQSISIGVINPFLYQTSTETLLIKSNLIFEIFSANEDGNFILKNIMCQGSTFDELKINAFSIASEEDFQYVFLFKAYNLYGNIMLQSYLFDIDKNHLDCGEIIFNIEEDEYQGGSGAGCSASVLNSYVIKKMLKGDFKRVLLVSTGALMSTTTSQQGETIPGIAHAVELELVEDSDTILKSSPKKPTRKNDQRSKKNG